jgi:thioredoxin 1
MPSESKLMEAVEGNQFVFIEFYADWCSPCKLMNSVLKKVESTFGDRIRVIKADVDKSPVMREKYNIEGLPTSMLFYNGECIWRRSGALPESYVIAELDAKLSIQI